jgi:hypothetical protein
MELRNKKKSHCFGRKTEFGQAPFLSGMSGLGSQTIYYSAAKILFSYSTKSFIGWTSYNKM